MTFPFVALLLAILLGAGADAGPAKDGDAPTWAEIDAAFRSARHEAAPDSTGLAGLAMPVEGMPASRLVDTYNAARGGGSRTHHALDIMAPRGSPVVAAAAGTVEKLHHSSLGGITAYVRSVDGRLMYYYAHLQSYAPGLHEGQRIERGDPIGRVGSTGNAAAAGPHLHFAISRLGAGDRWYQGSPINPYPLLAGRRVARR